MDITFEKYEWALTAGLYILMLKVNEETPGADEAYYRKTVDFLFEHMPQSLVEELADWSETDEGIQWRAAMRLGPFSDFPKEDVSKDTEQ